MIAEALAIIREHEGLRSAATIRVSGSAGGSIGVAHAVIQQAPRMSVDTNGCWLRRGMVFQRNDVE